MNLRAKAVITAVGVSSAAIILVCSLVIGGYLSNKLLPVLAFCLFWSNYVFFRATAQNAVTPNDPRPRILWKFCAALGTAGIYFAGALWALISFLNEREWYEIVGTFFSAGIGIFMLGVSKKLSASARDRAGDLAK